MHGVASEGGPLSSVMLHRPGSELRRLTPRNNDELRFDGVPWVARAQDEHDAVAGTLRERGVEVLYVRDLLVEALAVDAARVGLLAAALEPQLIGRVVVAYERSVETNARLVGEGIEVLPIAGSELGTGRGGPRCMSCPVTRT